MITFSEKAKGITVASISHPFGTAEISLYGAHILSFKPTGQKDVLFVSEKSLFETGKAIRGGIPICWPWFGPNVNKNLPSHGFIRTKNWNLKSIHEESNQTSISLEYSSTSETLAMWPYDFQVILTVLVGKTLKMTLTTINLGATTFSITDAFHTYFNIEKIESAAVVGLEGVQFIDRVGEKTLREQIGKISITGETDRVYLRSASSTIHDYAMNRKIIIDKTNLSDTVVWNPWIEKSKSMPDFKDDEYQRMICVEAGSVLDNPIVVPAGQSVTQEMTITPIIENGL